MSYISRVLKKQFKILKALETTPYIIVKGLGLNKIIVFPERRDTLKNIRFYSKMYQDEIDSGKYEDIRKFDSIHTADIEFSGLYHGKFVNKYHNRTKRQLVSLGNKWRERVAGEHPDAQIWIVVHYNDEDGWCLDTFNWDVAEIWATGPEHTIWL